MIPFQMVEDQREVDASMLLALFASLLLDQLQQQRLTRVKFWALWSKRDGKHRLLDTLINLAPIVHSGAASSTLLQSTSNSIQVQSS